MSEKLSGSVPGVEKKFAAVSFSARVLRFI